jgi:hypothetical protein
MKKSILLINCLCLFAQFYTSAQENTFSKVIYPDVQASSVVETFDNSYIITGKEIYFSGLIIKTDSSGDIIWNKTIGSISSQTRLIQIIASHDSAFLIAANQAAKAMCVKINSIGDIIWAKGYLPDNSSGSEACSLQPTIDSGFILTGCTYKPDSRVFILKLDLNGDVEWAKQLIGGNTYNIPYSAKQTLDGGYMVTGFMGNYPPSDYFAFLIKLTSDGSVSWSKKYKINGVGVSAGFDLEVLPDGYLWLLNAGLIKTNLSGNVLWCKKYISTRFNIIYSAPQPKLHKTYDSAYVFVTSGDFEINNIFKVDTAGNIIWKKYLHMIAADMTISRDKGYFIIGNGPIYGEIAEEIQEPHIGIIKTDSSGNGIDCIWDGYFQSEECFVTCDTLVLNIFTGGTQHSSNQIFDSLDLNTDNDCVSYLGVNENIETDEMISISPNPSNGVFQVSANTILTGNTGFEVLDITGKVLFNCHLYEGTTTSSIDCSGLVNGLYFYRILVNNTPAKAGKIVISK